MTRPDGSNLGMIAGLIGHGEEGGFLAPFARPTKITSSLPEQIADRLIDDIIKGALAPGQRLQEIAIAQRFGVSRGPVREALRIAEREGLVEIRPRYGAFVVKLSAKNVAEIFEVRALLMALAARRIANTCTEEMLAFLRDGSADLKESIDDAEQFFTAIYRYSMYVNAKWDNDLGRDILNSLARRTLHYTRIALLTPEHRRLWLKYWTAMVRAIARREPADAEAAMRGLVETVGGMVQQVMADQEAANRVRTAANG